MTYMGSGDPARRRNDYYPAWLDNLADDVTLGPLRWKVPPRARTRSVQ